MSDPAGDAAERAWNSADGQFWNQESAEAGAREALAPIREIHKPLRPEPGSSVGSTPGHIYCGGCIPDDPYYAETWPCPTARACYTTDEIQEMNRCSLG